MISSKKYVDETLRAHGLKANKALGQNFLIESSIAEEIVEQMNLAPSTVVIEIGPGMGALTEFLLKKAKLVLAYEIDASMVEILNENFSKQENFILTHIDFLKVNLEELLQQLTMKGYNDIRLVSNLPYYITSKLLNKIIVNNQNISMVVTMMQKEVGQKILNPDSKDKNLLTTMLAFQYEVGAVKYVGKNAYLPRPEIDSIVLKFKKIPPRYEVDYATFLRVCRALFSTRRKTILNNLKEIFLSKEDLLTCLSQLKLDVSLRVEQLSLKEIVDISNYIGK